MQPGIDEFPLARFRAEQPFDRVSGLSPGDVVVPPPSGGTARSNELRAVPHLPAGSGGQSVDPVAISKSCRKMSGDGTPGGASTQTMPLFISANFALSADGKISTRGRGGAGFGSKEDQRRLLALRAESDAVLVGQATLLADRMSLGLGLGSEWQENRLTDGQTEFPARVVVGGRRPLDADHPVFTATAGPLHFLLSPGQDAPANADGVVWHRAEKSDPPDLIARILSLADAEGWRHLHCEGGSRIFNALVQAGRIDVLHLTIVPVVFGGHAAPRLLPPDAGWAVSRGFHLVAMESVGDEIFLRYERAKNP